MKTGLIGSSILISFFSASILSVQAGDFGNAQQTYVPTSLIPRRYDSEPVGQTNWGWNSGGATTPGSANSNGSGVLSAVAIINVIDSARTPAALSAAFSQGKKSLQKLIDKGKWEDAEKVALRLAKVNPKDQEVKDKLTQILIAEARIAYNKPDMDRAAGKARETLTSEPTNQPAKLILSQVFAKRGLNFQSAKDHLKIADSLGAHGKFVEANVEYRLALGIKASAAAHIGLGNIATSQGHLEEAEREYQNAIQLDSKSSTAYRQLGFLKFAMHDVVGANRDLTKAVTLNGSDELAASALIELWQRQVSSNMTAVNGYLGLARVFLLTGNLEAAQTEYRQVAKMDPNNPQLPPARVAFKAALAKREAQKCVEAAKTLNGQGAFRDAYEKLAESMHYAKATPDVLILNGQICEKLGLYEAAHEAYMDVLREDPSNVVAAQRLRALPAAPHAAIPDKSLPAVAPINQNYNFQSVPKIASPSSSMIIPSSGFPSKGVPFATLPAPDGADTLGHTSMLGNFVNAFRSMSANKPQPATGLPLGSNSAYLPAVSYGGMNAPAPNMMTVAMPQTIQGSNGAYYMVPIAVPMTMNAFGPKNDQPNPLLNDLGNSRIGKKFHVAQVVQDSSGFSSLLSNIKIPARQNSQTQVTGALAPSTLSNPQYLSLSEPGSSSEQPISVQVGESSPTQLVPVQDWNTASGETETAGSASGSNQLDRVPAANSFANGGSIATEVALKPAMGTMALGASMAHAITLKVSDVKPTLTGARVKVVLKNSSSNGLNIPESQKIAWQCGDKPEKLLNIQFATHHVPPGGSVYGIIIFPEHQLDPDADLYLPKFLEEDKKLTDLHATADM